MATYRYRSQRGRIRAVIDGEWSRTDKKKNVRIYDTNWRLVATIRLGPGETVRKTKPKMNVCTAHKLPLEKGKLVCKFIPIPGIPAVPCVLAYDRALAEVGSKPSKNWNVTTVPNKPLPGIEVHS